MTTNSVTAVIPRCDGGYALPWVRSAARAEWLPQVMFQDSKVLPCKQFQNMKPSCDTNSEAPWSLVISVACESCGDRSARVTSYSEDILPVGRARSALGCPSAKRSSSGNFKHGFSCPFGSKVGNQKVMGYPIFPQLTPAKDARRAGVGLRAV
jgi:hypothetical protein